MYFTPDPTSTRPRDRDVRRTRIPPRTSFLLVSSTDTDPRDPSTETLSRLNNPTRDPRCVHPRPPSPSPVSLSTRRHVRGPVGDTGFLYPTHFRSLLTPPPDPSPQSTPTHEDIVFPTEKRVGALVVLEDSPLDLDM